jgi:hypothetical protein
MRLAVATVEPGEDAEQFRVPLRRHDGVELGELGRVEAVVGRAPRLDVARQQRELERLRHVEPRILQQRRQIVGGWAQHGILKVDDADFRDAGPLLEPDQIGRMKVAQRPGSRRRRGLAQQIAP